MVGNEAKPAGACGGGGGASAARPKPASTTRSSTCTGSSAGNGPSPAAAAASASSEEPLHVLYPINSFVELTLGPDNEKSAGIVVCTDDISNTIVLKKSLVHTTLANDVRLVCAGSVVGRRIIKRAGGGGECEGKGEGEEEDGTDRGSPTVTLAEVEEMARPLPPPPTRRALEDRERRALKLAEENLRHINDNATPEGQATFDRLLKACNEVVWADGDAIVVLGQVRVDTPYGPDNCTLVRLGKTDKERGLAQGSLERVKKIVAHEG